MSVKVLNLRKGRFSAFPRGGGGIGFLAFSLRLLCYLEEGRIFDQCQATVLPDLKLASVEHITSKKAKKNSSVSKEDLCSSVR